jgi:hypothetical protein
MTKNGLGADSQILTGLSILIGGKSTFGYTGDGTKSPEFEFEQVNEQSTGIVKQPYMTLEAYNLGAEFVSHIASGLPFVLRGNLRRDGEDKPYLVTCQGQLKKLSGEIKEGDAVKRTFEIRVDMYSEVVDNVPAIIYNREPYKCILGGVDTAPDFNNNI